MPSLSRTELVGPASEDRSDLVRLPKLRLHSEEELLLGSGDQLLGAVLVLVRSRLVLPALLGPAALLQTDLSLSGLQDLLSLCLPLKHLDKKQLLVNSGHVPGLWTNQTLIWTTRTSPMLLRTLGSHSGDEALLVLLEAGQSRTHVQQRGHALPRAARQQASTVLNPQAVEDVLAHLRTGPTGEDISFDDGGDKTVLTGTSPTLMLRVGSLCLSRMSQTSRTPSVFTVKKTAGLTGLQQASISRDVWYLNHQQVRLEL